MRLSSNTALLPFMMNTGRLQPSREEATELAFVFEMPKGTIRLAEAKAGTERTAIGYAGIESILFDLPASPRDGVDFHTIELLFPASQTAFRKPVSQTRNHLERGFENQRERAVAAGNFSTAESSAARIFDAAHAIVAQCRGMKDPGYFTLRG